MSCLDPFVLLSLCSCFDRWGTLCVFLLYVSCVLLPVCCLRLLVYVIATFFVSVFLCACLNACLVFVGFNVLVFVCVSRACVMEAVVCVCVLYVLFALLCVFVSNVSFVCRV